uniref:Uncharacterized protein n=1 Tax=Siphoviridae sp. ctnR613 TaxID=2827939 RepID=A0A8S5SNJ0_9CAUD|nr:MAG TPA: hypothetical protein [Siphoviridae sp. ctnR613]
MDKLDYKKKYFKLASNLSNDFYLYFTTSKRNITEIKKRENNKTVGYYYNDLDNEDNKNYEIAYKMLKMLFDLKIVY